MRSAELLRSVRVRSGLTQTEVARRARTSQPVVSAYERGHREPSVATLERLVAAAGGRLELRTADVRSDRSTPVDDVERGRRVVDVLLLADALPTRPKRAFAAPRMDSGSPPR
jgi:transcriptional regulator with XRE-family HTH domain